VSEPSGVNQILGLLERLRNTVREFNRREEALQRDVTLKTGALQRQRDNETEALKTRHPEELNEAETASQAVRSHVTQRHADRKARITQFHKTLNRRAAQWIEDREGRRKHKLQAENLQNQRGRESGLAANEQTYKDYTAALQSEEQALASAEDDAHRAFKGFGAFKRRLHDTKGGSEPEARQDENQLFEELRAALNRANEDLRAFRRLPLPALVRLWPLWLVLLLIPLPLVPLLQDSEVAGLNPKRQTLAAGLEPTSQRFPKRGGTCRQAIGIAKVVYLSQLFARKHYLYAFVAFSIGHRPPPSWQIC